MVVKRVLSMGLVNVFKGAAQYEVFAFLFAKVIGLLFFCGFNFTELWRFSIFNFVEL
jgi:hypothetical protein